MHNYGTLERDAASIPYLKKPILSVMAPPSPYLIPAQLSPIIASVTDHLTRTGSLLQFMICMVGAVGCFSICCEYALL